jgi:putative transcriptional regulator
MLDIFKNVVIMDVKLALQGASMENQLERMRDQRGLTQQELADLAGVSRQTIISLERGRYNPSIILAIKLARLFGVSVEELFIYCEEDEHE